MTKKYELWKSVEEGQFLGDFEKYNCNVVFDGSTQSFGQGFCPNKDYEAIEEMAYQIAQKFPYENGDTICQKVFQDENDKALNTPIPTAVAMFEQLLKQHTRI